MRIKGNKPFEFDFEISLINTNKGLIGYLDTFLVFFILGVITYFIFFYLPTLKVYCPDKIKIFEIEENKILAFCQYSAFADTSYKELDCVNAIDGNSSISKNSFPLNFTNVSKIKGILRE